jgi:short-subunit dehydrogenase
MHDWVKEVAAQFPIDIVIANAGISAGTLGGAEATEQVYQIFDTNLYGVLNTILPAIEVMLAQQSGQIVLISSIAGILPMASAPSYSTTKSALKTLGDTLRVDLAKYGINVNIVIPGFIKTPLTDKNDFPMPFIKSSTEAAEIIITGIKQNKPYIYFPKAMFYLAKFISIFPRPLLDYIMKKLPAKRALQEKILN